MSNFSVKITVAVLICLMAASCKKDNDGPTIDLASGLYTWLPFDGNKKDSLGNENNISVSSLGTAMIKDRKGTPDHAIFFDGVKGEIKYGNITWPAGLLTVACWVKKANDLQQLSFITAENFEFGMFQDLGAMSFLVRKDNNLLYPATIEIGTEWTHLVATYDSHEIRFYVNGEFKASLAVEVSLGYTESLILGFSDGAHWRGNLDDMRIYGRVLDIAEIKALASL